MPGTARRRGTLRETLSSRLVLVLGPLAMANFGAVNPEAHAPPRDQPRVPACNAVSNQDVVGPGAAIDTGQYTLTLVATGGQSGGASVRGGLYLTAQGVTHDSGGSTKASHKAPGRPLEAQYGATEVDLTGVGASVTSDSANQAPSAHSVSRRSSRRPGLAPHRYRSQQSRLATVDRDREQRPAGLQARRCLLGCDASPRGPAWCSTYTGLVPTGFAGSWRSAGSGDVHGYFCAAPVRYYSPYQSRYLPQGPQPSLGRLATARHISG